MGSDVGANTGFGIATVATVGGIFGSAIAHDRAQVLGARVVAATTELATARHRQSTVTPALFGPDSPQALDDAVRGTQDALPGLREAARGARRLGYGIFAGGALVAAAGVALMFTSDTATTRG